MERFGSYKIIRRKVILFLRDRICETPEELLESSLFSEILNRYIQELKRKEASILGIFGKEAASIGPSDIRELLQVIQVLEKMNMDSVSKLVPGGRRFAEAPELLRDLIEGLYNYWRQFERFIVCDSTGDRLDRRPYRTFNSTIETLTHLVRQTYRDVEENITGQHPDIYRQVRAGAEVAVIALPMEVLLPDGPYRKLKNVPVIRQILLYPPLLINPPMNIRSGKFERVDRNPLDLIDLTDGEWLCYPAKVGPLLILVYIHETFYELGMALCNLFELADDAFLKQPVAGVYLFGAPGTALDSLAQTPTVFYDDDQHGLVSAACPNRDEFGYFGYLKKMILTLHNIRMMHIGKMPFHGAMVRVVMKDRAPATILIIGDTGAGKSETLEAFRTIGADRLEEMVIVADDMGSLDLDPAGNVTGYGTEVGAFVRLDDLQPGYAFGQLDRSIIMNPNQVNARIVLPVTTYENVMRGYAVDMILYANNYEEIDDEHPIIERFPDAGEALRAFREGTAMSKGTTTSTGLVHTYFVNVFGPAQYRQIHDQLAERFFRIFFEKGIYVGQLRTRLGIPGWEREGPEEAAKALFQMAGRNRTREDESG